MYNLSVLCVTPQIIIDGPLREKCVPTFPENPGHAIRYLRQKQTQKTFNTHTLHHVCYVKNDTDKK